MTRDLEMLHSGLQAVLKTLNLPPLGQLQSAKHIPQTPASDLNHADEDGPSCDNSPRCSPVDDNDLPNVPIQSVYHLTKLSALRSPHSRETVDSSTQVDKVMNDFISRGALSLNDAERLFQFYMEHLDPYIYSLGGRYKTLDALRRASEILTVSILTVAALHDPQGSAIYGTCSKEFRRVFSASVLNRRIDRDYLRAICVASYWLSDTSWILSGHAIRRAAELDLFNHYKRALADHNEDAVDFVRLW
jgi:hypothetical protein